jgi:hypothetical protein
MEGHRVEGDHYPKTPFQPLNHLRTMVWNLTLQPQSPGSQCKHGEKQYAAQGHASSP